MHSNLSFQQLYQLACGKLCWRPRRAHVGPRICWAILAVAEPAIHACCRLSSLIQTRTLVKSLSQCGRRWVVCAQRSDTLHCLLTWCREVARNPVRQFGMTWMWGTPCQSAQQSSPVQSCCHAAVILSTWVWESSLHGVQVRNRNSEEYNVLKIQLEGIIEELERHFEQASWQSHERPGLEHLSCCHGWIRSTRPANDIAPSALGA